MNRPTCETCAYWHQWKKDSKNYGDCHKRAPTLVGEVRCGPEWPDDLAHDDWCGDHHLFQSYIASLSSGEAKREEWYGSDDDDPPPHPMRPWRTSDSPPQVEVLEGIPDELYMLWVCGSDKEDGHWAHPIDQVCGGEIYLVLTDHKTAKVAAKEQMEKYPSLGTITAVRVL